MRSNGGVVHTVLIEWRAGMPDATLAAIPDLVDRFAAEIPGVVSAVHGPSVSPEGLEGGFGFGLVVAFTDRASRDGYLTHPTHGEFGALVGDWIERVAVFDIAT